VAAAVGAALATWSPYAVERLLLGQPPTLLAVSTLPWIVLVAREVKGPRRWLMLTTVAALPAALSGAKIAVAVAVIGAVFAEYAGSSSGLGHLMLQAIPQLETPRAYAAVVLLAAFAVALFSALALAERRLEADVARRGAAIGTVDEAAPRQLVDVAADRLGREAELLGQRRDPHGRAGGERGDDALVPPLLLVGAARLHEAPAGKPPVD